MKYMILLQKILTIKIWVKSLNIWAKNYFGIEKLIISIGIFLYY